MFVICIAGLKVGIDNRYEYTEEECRPYCINDKMTDFCVSVSDKEIDSFLCQWPGIYDGVKITPSLAEHTVLRSKIQPHLLRYNAFFLHSCVVEMEGAAYAFSADSGVGKSTHASLWLRAFGEKAKVINGDLPIIRRIEGTFYAYGTPWGGKEGWQVNTRSPLRSICFLERGSSNMIRRLNAAEAFLYLRHNSRAPKTAAEIVTFLDLMDCLFESVPAYLLQCNMEDNAALVAYGCMSEKVSKIYELTQLLD
jgi:hypothetical protein